MAWARGPGSGHCRPLSRTWLGPWGVTHLCPCPQLNAEEMPHPRRAEGKWMSFLISSAFWTSEKGERSCHLCSAYRAGNYSQSHAPQHLQTPGPEVFLACNMEWGFAVFRDEGGISPPSSTIYELCAHRRVI